MKDESTRNDERASSNGQTPGERKEVRDAPDGDELLEDVRRLAEVDADPSEGRGEPGDGTAGASGPGGDAS